MKRFQAFLVVLVSACLLSAQTQPQLRVIANPIGEHFPRFGVLGDSFSTYSGYMTPNNGCHYPTDEVRSVEQTWWWLFGHETGSQMVQNNSLSGGSICNTSWDGKYNPNNSFVARMKDMKEADLYIIEGGTNDGYQAPEGQYQYDNWPTDKEELNQLLRNFRPALAYVISYFQTTYPNAQLVFMLNSGRPDRIVQAVNTICKHYNVPVYLLQDNVTKVNIHPSKEGMVLMRNQFTNLLINREEGWRMLDETGSYTQSQSTTLDKVYLRRNMPKGVWTPVCFPFDADENIIQMIFGKGTKVATYVGSEGYTMKFVTTNHITAHEPCFINPGSDCTKAICLEGLDVVGGRARSVGPSNCQLTGLYAMTKASATDGTILNIDNASVYNAGQDNNLRAFSAYLKVRNGLHPEINIDGLSLDVEAERTTFVRPDGAPAMTILTDSRASGGEYVGSLGQGNSLRFNYYAAMPGTYRMTIYFMTANTRSIRISINGASPRTVSCPSSGYWDATRIGNARINVTLKAGVNSFEISNPTGDMPNIDRFTFRLTAPAAEPDLTEGTFEAERTTFVNSGNYSQNIAIKEDELCSGGLRVDSVGRGNTLTFNYVAEQDGYYEMTTHYMCAVDNRFMIVSVNGEKVDTVQFENHGAWDGTALATVKNYLKLQAGDNLITIAGTSSRYLPNLDKFVLTYYSTIDGIGDIKASKESDGNTPGPAYDLSGRPIPEKSAQKGIYIRNRKKIVTR